MFENFINEKSSTNQITIDEIIEKYKKLGVQNPEFLGKVFKDYFGKKQIYFFSDQPEIGIVKKIVTSWAFETQYSAYTDRLFGEVHFSIYKNKNTYVIQDDRNLGGYYVTDEIKKQL